MKSTHLYYLLPLLVFMGYVNKYQPDPGDTIISNLQKWRENNPQEKVFVQTDREKYVAGETIWFKSWCIVDNKPTFLSRIIYVTLSNAAGKIIDKKMFNLDKLSSANGLFDLDKNLKTGNYTLSAYTLWMLNYPQFVFNKAITIYGSDFNEKTKVMPWTKNQFDFFPEGGDMIAGVLGQLAFKAVSSSGYPMAFKGAIYAGDGTKATDIQSQYDGMGAVDFEPAPDKNYTAKVIFADGQTGEFKLPAAKKEGIALQVNNNSPSRIAVVLNRGELNKEKYKKILVIAQISGIPVFKASFNIDDGEAGTSIPKKDLPGGLMQITAFDTAGNPLSERLLFVDNHQIVSPEINAQIKSTTKRARNVLSFHLDNVDAAALSVLVMDASVDTTQYQKDNIASSFLMTSDIKGYIHNPGYYFSNKQPGTLQNLDLLLLTQGWRRFTWKQIKAGEDIVLKYPVETFMNIGGLVTKSDRKEPLKSGFVTLITKAEDSTTILTNAKLTDKGEFIVDSLVFRNKAKISYQGTDNNKLRLPVDVKIYPTYIDTLKQQQLMRGIAVNNSPLNADLPKSLVNILQERINNNAKTLEAVTVKGKALSKVDSLQKQYVSPVYEMSDHSLFIPEGKHYLNIWQFLNQQVPGFNVNPFQPGGVTYASFSRYDGLSLTDSEQGIKFFINEMPVDISSLDAINPDDVALVKVYKGATGFALGAEAGAISVYTRKGVDIKNAVYDKTFTTIDKIGFAFTREFYSPNYTLHKDLNAKESDDRMILYWQPNAKKSSNGEYLVEFHNSDATTAFKVIIQGIDSKGQLIYKEQLIK